MKKLLPGRRIAAKLWVDRVAQCVGFRQFFYHQEKQLTCGCEVHMDGSRIST
jgi:hypothetical protein